MLQTTNGDTLTSLSARRLGAKTSPACRQMRGVLAARCARYQWPCRHCTG
jgi:hypothetical protein